jgi:hypothetical protein
MGVDDINLIQDKEHCWTLVDTTMNLRFPNITFSKVALLLEVRGGSKGKGVPNRPGVAQRVPGGLGSQIFMTFGT